MLDLSCPELAHCVPGVGSLVVPGTARQRRPPRHAAHAGAWMAVSDAAGLPCRCAITDKKSGHVIGGVALLPLPPSGTDLEIAWQMAPAMWGHGYSAEAGHAVAHQDFEKAGLSEVSAVVRRGNHRGVATARRVGWNGSARPPDTTGYPFRSIARGRRDLDLPEPGCADVSEPYAPVD
jgi:hypothetical protein